VFVGIARIIGVEGFVREVVGINLRDPGCEPSLPVGTRPAAFPGRVANHIVCAVVTFDAKHAIGRDAQAAFADKELGVFDRHLREQVAGVFREAAIGPRLFGERQEVERQHTQVAEPRAVPLAFVLECFAGRAGVDAFATPLSANVVSERRVLRLCLKVRL
jgi:hypothetical protein